VSGGWRAILATLAVAVAIAAWLVIQRMADETKRKATVTRIRLVELCLGDVSQAAGRPVSSAEWNALFRDLGSASSTAMPGPCRNIQRRPSDAWGHPLHFMAPAQHGDAEFEIWSDGADGLPGGEGADADLGTWDFSAVRGE